MMNKDCREHHFTSSGRCRYCQIQARYYYECMTTLNSWSKKEKRNPNEHWQEKVDSLRCKLHIHED
jgi:hypothetical protein